jgi:pyrroloquinoline quinone (PQQ) biosynthesis protein C
MSRVDEVLREWAPAFEEMSRSEGFRRILVGEGTVRHYASVLRQIFHHARENPQIQTLAAVYFRGQQREMVKPFFRHATSEIGHDELARNDLMALGVDVSTLALERPLPATTALLALPFFLIQFRNPVAYLGYLFHLEFMPTSDGARYMTGLRQMGVPDSAMSFVRDHSQIDVAHNKLMEQYLERLICSEDDLADVIYAAKTTAYLYGQMVSEAFRCADTPRMYGISPDERRLAVPPDRVTF